MDASPGSSGNITSILFYAVIVVFIGLVILVIIHYTYKPIFGKKSILSGDAGTVYWETEQQSQHDDIQTATTPLGNRYCDYSFVFDMIIDDPLAGTGSGAARSVMKREATGAVSNIDIALDKDVNDLHIRLTCKEDENTVYPVVVVENLPTRKGFTIGIILTETFMEVYLNGRLYKTKTFGAAKLMDVAGNFKSGLRSDAYGRMKRFRLWPSVVDTESMRTYGGRVEPAFKVIPMMSTGGETCAAS